MTNESVYVAGIEYPTLDDAYKARGETHQRSYVAHRWIGEDDCVSCLTCGAHYCDGREDDAERCTGRTDLVHPTSGDASSHSLDNCAQFDATDDCEHIAYHYGCNCSLCLS